VLFFRLSRVTVHVLIGLAICALLFPWLGDAARDGHIRRWSGKLLRICNIEVEHAPGSAEVLRQAMVVCNHVSWLDIFVILSLYPSRFVAKSEIRAWPVLGWLAEKAGTIFIARGNKRDLRRLFTGLVAQLTVGQRVAFFPEGTTAAQGSLLAFQPNLFESAIDAHVPVQPFAIAYVDGDGALHGAVDFIGEMSFAESLVIILKGPPIVARLACLAPIGTEGAHRRELALASHQAVAAALGHGPGLASERSV